MSTYMTHVGRQRGIKLRQEGVIWWCGRPGPPPSELRQSVSHATVEAAAGKSMGQVKAIPPPATPPLPEVRIFKIGIYSLGIY